MTEETETPKPADAAGRLDELVMPTIRTDLMDAISRYRDLNRGNALAQVKTTQESLNDAMRYMIRSDAADGFAMLIHGVLQKHGL